VGAAVLKIAKAEPARKTGLVADRSRWQAAYLQSIDPMKKPKPPKVLDAIADVVLAYRPKPKTKPARK
jgi:hypothetical protein